MTAAKCRNFKACCECGETDVTPSLLPPPRHPAYLPGRLPEIHSGERDPRYRREFEHAEALIGATIHEEIRRRAIDGWDVPIFYQGKQSGSIGKYSDRLLLLLAKAHCPEFRHYVTAEHCGQPDVRVRVEFVDIEPNDARRERVIERAQKNFGVRPVQCGTDRGAVAGNFLNLLNNKTT